VRESEEVWEALVHRTGGPLPGVLGTQLPTAFLNVPPTPIFNAPIKAAPSTSIAVVFVLGLLQKLSLEASN